MAKRRFKIKEAQPTVTVTLTADEAYTLHEALISRPYEISKLPYYADKPAKLTEVLAPFRELATLFDEITDNL